MPRAKPQTISLTRTHLIISLLLAALCGAGLVILLNPTPEVPLSMQEKDLPDTATVIETKPVPKKPVTVEKKTQAKQARQVNTGDTFIIKGLIDTAGEPLSAKLLRVKLLWLKNKNQQPALIGHETALVQMTRQGLAYQFVLRPQPGSYVNFNGGVEGNIARVIAYIDQQQDGQLTPGQDKILAVSKEVLRYRTGRYDKSKLNDIQIKNIQKAGKGYVFIRNEPDDKGKMDWRVVADRSPVRLDLDATEKSLPAMYTTILKLQ